MVKLRNCQTGECFINFINSLLKRKLPIYLQLPHTAVAFSENLFFGQISK
jgi:hypothetical protein